MLNLVTNPEGVGAAVLVRSCEPVAGLDTVLRRRSGPKGRAPEGTTLLAGPGKVGQALGLDTSWSHHPLYEPGGLELLDAPPPEALLVGPRIGVDYADPDHRHAPWRFASAGTAWVTERASLRPWNGAAP
jgi:DNA-3-methyladenine glycosylase